MANWFGRKAPALVPTDTVLPLRYWDDTVVLKSLVVYSMAKYDVALDAEKLHNSLERLVARKGWRKLGARLRKNVKGQIEYHIPAEFTADRPGVSFSHVKHDMAIGQHPLASQLPKPSSQPAVVGDPEQFASMARPAGTPTSIDDYLNQDRGQVGLHIVSFTDATLVVLYYNHTSFDLLGWGAMMTAWTHMLHGREDQILDPLGPETAGPDGADPLRDLGTAPTEPHVLADRQLLTSGLVGYGLRNVADMAVRKKENRIVCIPGAFIDKLRAQSIAELQAEARPGEPKPFLSDNDVLLAWWARMTVSDVVNPSSNRTISIQNAASARKALGLSDSRPYVSNAFTIRYTVLPARELLGARISDVARTIRQNLIEQGSREQIEAYFALQRVAPGKVLPFFGDAGMHMLTFSNWTKADLYGHDFSPAVLGGSATTSKAVFPSYIQTSQLPFSFPEGFLVIGQDQARNYWLYGFRIAGLWAKVEKALAEMEKS